MSSPRTIRVELAPRARQDFEDILRYTAETWGQPQMLAYRDKIDDALQAISRNPQLGHRRSDLPPTHLAYLVGSHIIIYRLGDDKLGVVRILHERMSLPRHV
jgi:toxin ParE1/3/4